MFFVILLLKLLLEEFVAVKLCADSGVTFQSVICEGDGRISLITNYGNKNSVLFMFKMACKDHWSQSSPFSL